ncbi:MAG: acyl-CoA thioesterase [Pseudomonadales bacterium]|nr:acyl-CoA thioesterase [Pseudomonadales bacterium]MCP5171181.1 acyl-CoA thioesterase [Pseudomonadales bacterium]MCP5301581.1 acyl-CoA thioesterase [Pseudomonadales bacterium]
MSSKPSELEPFEFTYTIDIAPDPNEELHINNVQYFHFFAEARNAYMSRVGCPGYDKNTGMGYVAASNHCDYKTALHSPDKIHIGVKTENIGNTSLKVIMKIFSHAQNVVAAEGYTVVVPYDFNTNTKMGISDTMKRLISRTDNVAL